MTDIAQTGDPVQARLLAALMNGRALTANELARAARVSPSTTSGHLDRLMDAHVLLIERQGRHRYFRLASSPADQRPEAAIATAGRGVLPAWRGTEALRNARTCYDHIAGRLGVALADALTRANHLAPDQNALTDQGHAFLRDFGASPAAGTRIACRPCLDWSERRPHIAGRLGAALANRCLDLRWITRQSNARVLTITERGVQGFAETFGIHLPA